MIAFATIFLGLILGVQEIEVVVGEEVATVELLLDGENVGTLTQPPWTLRCDLGDELAPRLLVAVARGAGGDELGRARQWLNLPQPPAHVTVALEGGGEGQPHVARLSWESLAGATPQRVAVSFDGGPLAVADPRRVVLPPHDERQLHFLRAELEFSDNVTSVAEVTFGGTYADQVSSELTAVPVTAKRSKVRKKGALDGLLLDKGEPLRVVAIEKESAQIVVVPQGTIRPLLEDLSRLQPAMLRLPMAERVERLRTAASFGPRQFVRFLWPVVQHQEGTRQRYDLFPKSYEYGPEVGGFYYLLYRAFDEPHRGEERLADAVAVAGLHAAEQRQRRAVVLLLGEDTDAPDPSQLTPLQARRYLERLRVPLHVWSLAGTSEPEGWGEVLDVSGLDRLETAVEKLMWSLDRQWLVWIDGVHLPQEISLGPQAKGVELVE